MGQGPHRFSAAPRACGRPGYIASGAESSRRQILAKPHHGPRVAGLGIRRTASAREASPPWAGPRDAPPAWPRPSRRGTFRFPTGPGADIRGPPWGVPLAGDPDQRRWDRVPATFASLPRGAHEHLRLLRPPRAVHRALRPLPLECRASQAPCRERLPAKRAAYAAPPFGWGVSPPRSKAERPDAGRPPPSNSAGRRRARPPTRRAHCPARAPVHVGARAAAGHACHACGTG